VKRIANPRSNEKRKKLIGGYAELSIGTIPEKEGKKQVLASLAPHSRIVVSLFRVIYEQTNHSSQMTEAKNIALATW